MFDCANVVVIYLSQSFLVELCAAMFAVFVDMQKRSIWKVNSARSGKKHPFHIPRLQNANTAWVKLDGALKDLSHFGQSKLQKNLSTSTFYTRRCFMKCGTLHKFIGQIVAMVKQDCKTNCWFCVQFSIFKVSRKLVVLSHLIKSYRVDYGLGTVWWELCWKWPSRYKCHTWD